jgi:PAS domain S-box-containing protein
MSSRQKPGHGVPPPGLENHKKSPQGVVSHNGIPSNGSVLTPSFIPFPAIGTASNQIFNSVQEGIVVYGPDLRYVVWNPYMEQLTGIPSCEIIGRHPHEVFPFLLSSGILANLERSLQGEPTKEIMFKFTLPTNGRVGWATDTSSPLRGDSGEIIGVIGVVKDITEQKLINVAQQFLAEFDSIASGEDFFKSLARFLAESLDMEFVCIDQLTGDDNRAKTVAYYVDGCFQDNVEYALKDTPCGDVVGKTICCFPRDVCRLFEKDELLQSFSAESYIGTTLWDSRHHPIGLIAVIGRKPLPKPELAESMLKLVSLRAAAELEQRKASETLIEANIGLEHKVTERTMELQKNHDLLRDLSSQVPGIIFQFSLANDGTMSFPFISSAVEDLYELSPESVKGDANTAFSRIHPDDHDGLMASIFESARSLETWEREFRAILPQKGLRWFAGKARTQEDGHGGTIWHGFINDITDIKLLENDLRKSQYLLASAQRQADIGNWNWIVKTDTVSWSEHLYAIFGRDPQLPSIRYEDQARMYIPESWTRLDTSVQRSLETGEGYELELEMIRHDGVHRIVIAKGEAHCDQNGKVEELRGTLQDVTEKVLLERRLYQARKMESIGQLAAGVAHEVRNPLNAILSLTEALFRETALENNKDFEPYIHHLRTQVNRLAQLMNDLLELGKPIAQNNLHPVPLHSLCQETIELWESSGFAQKKPIHFISDCDASDLIVVADSLKLQQAIFNLVENAAQHSPDCNPITLQVLDPETADSISVKVIDAGTGIPEISLSRIFDPFYTERKNGTGLGLALVRHFMTNMGGSVVIYNNDPPPGCTAEIRIPRANKEQM